MERGVSLVEVMMVLALIALLLRLAAGGWQGSNSDRVLRAAQGAIAGRLESARIGAALRQRPGRLLVLADLPGNGAPDQRLRQCLVVVASPEDDGLWIPQGEPTLLPEPVRVVPPSAPAMAPPRAWGDAPRSSVAAPVAVRVRFAGGERADRYHVVEFTPRGTAVGATLLLSPARRPGDEGPVQFIEPADLLGIRISQYGFLTLLSDAGAF
jgi:prepilin-type N-terminal cleavage/methylation domain-containing protein